jgi:tetratricopeptide (TPR) repeat protein
MAYQSEIEKLEARFREKPEQWFAALADAYRKSGDVEMALEVLHAWIEKRPNYSSGNIVLGRCLLEQGKLDEATQAFERVLSLDMENIIALKSMAEITERKGDADGAKAWLQKLLEADPMNDEARHAIERIDRGELLPPPEPKEAPAEAAATPEPAPAVEPPQPPALAEPAAPEPVAAEEPAVSGPAVADIPPEDIAAIAEKDTVPFEASAPPSGFEGAPAADAPGDATVPDLEPMEFEGATDEEPAPVAGLDSSGLEETMIEMPSGQLEETVDEMPETPMPAELLPTDAGAEETLIDTPAPDLPLVQPPADVAPAAPLTPVSSTAADDVQFVEPTVEVEEIPAEPEPAAVADEGTPELPIILPEEVEPDLDEPVLDEPTIREPEPVVTETMAELYVSQGLYAEAVDIYEQLLARNPDDTRFEQRLAELREQAAGEARETQPSRRDGYAAEQTGGVSVRQLLADLAAGPVTTAVPAAAAVEEPPVQAEPQGEGSGFSFDQYFGSDGEQEAPAPEAAPEAPQSGPEDGGGNAGQSGDFQDWLKGLKS